MTIVMGLDQHRAQITTEWLDTDTGELGRARVTPAHRESVRHFLSRFSGQELEVALEATTGWRFVVEELRAVGAEVHLAEPAETAARRGRKKRAKTDRADARHLRRAVDGRAAARSRGSRPITSLTYAPACGCATHFLSSAASGSSGSKRCSTTTGFRSARQLMSGEGRAWLAGLAAVGHSA